MAHSKPIPKHKCQRCPKSATVEVLNNHNSSHGYFCTSCGKTEVRRLNIEEERINQRMRVTSQT